MPLTEESFVTIPPPAAAATDPTTTATTIPAELSNDNTTISLSSFLLVLILLLPVIAVLYPNLVQTLYTKIMSCFQFCCGGKSSSEEEDKSKYGAFVEPEWNSGYYGDEAATEASTPTADPDSKTTNDDDDDPKEAAASSTTENGAETSNDRTASSSSATKKHHHNSICANNQNEFHSRYSLGKYLGKGNFATVKEGVRIDAASNHDPHHVYAIKIVDKSKLNEEDEIALRDEIKIQHSLHHENIVRLYETYDEPSSYFLVLELVSGGELFDRIVQKEYYNEKEARDVLKIIFDAIGYCHEKNIAHRDLKPENLLLKSTTNDTEIKIADFGFSKIVEKPNSLVTQCGTPAFVAPEILNGLLYDERSDNWSLGVLAYILLGGYPPFRENDLRKLFRLIRKGDYEFHDEYWSAVSKDAKAFIESLLTVDHEQRATAKDALHHRWMVKVDDTSLSRRNLMANLEEFKRFNAKRKFKSAVGAVIATNKLTSLGHDFHKHL